MRILGINDSSHDAAVAVVENGKILFAAHAERYEVNKNTFHLNNDIVKEAMSYGKPDKIAYFEKRSLKRVRLALHGGINGQYAKHNYTKLGLYKFLDEVEEVQISHHRSHAAAGYMTSPFDDATIVVLDAIGEFETASIWTAAGNKMRRRWSMKYPTSFGLFYSHMTNLVGLVPAQDEYILMGMAAFGDKERYSKYLNSLFPQYESQAVNFHKKRNVGIDIKSEQDKFDLAAATQHVFEARLMDLMVLAKSIGKSKNLVYMGGCALNCSANTKLFEVFDNVWIMPNPGDAGSSLGAALSVYGEKIEWKGPYLGTPVGGHYPVHQILHELNHCGVVGVMNGRAEFGPRALGNRSLLADPRDNGSKQRLNSIKKREQFRPFAPVVLEEEANDWFDLPAPSPYMQFAVRAKKPDLIPGAVHVDGTSRVQTVSKQQHPGLHEVLVRWRNMTGIPVLINTSLNIKNQPLLNDARDGRQWREKYPSVPLVIGS